MPYQILERHNLVEVDALRRYLLETVVHMIGGFGKAPGELPGMCLTPYASVGIRNNANDIQICCTPTSGLPHWRSTASLD